MKMMILHVSETLVSAALLVVGLAVVVPMAAFVCLGYLLARWSK